jgi:Flp pilus assembly protein TadG
MWRRKLRTYVSQRRGAGSAEFAMILPAFFALTFGIIHFSIIMYAETTLHAAAEAAARCASINLNAAGGSSCLTADTIATYASSKYAGPSVSQSFAYSSATCGNQVTATGTYKISMAFMSVTVPLSAKSCYP